jgi:glycine cleavage system H lipoate-binding protein
MEGFTYVDIFATKGTEYLLVIGFLAVFILFWRFLSTPAKAAYEYVTETVIPAISEWFHLPEGMYYHQGHTWAVPEGNTVKVGMDDFAQKLVGRPSTINLPQVGSRIEQGSHGWKLGFDSASIDMVAPVNGEVVKVNEEVIKNPDLINQDPYGKGWFMMIKPRNLKADLKNLLTGRLASAWMEETVDSLRERMGEDIGAVYQDGGIVVSGIAKALSPDKWDEVAKEYLLSS